jgi:sporadic carbohydrate cluster protein (TIGR04323 family)
MTVASVTTDINIGPFKIPSNAQNMIMNNYAQRNQISIELVIPEPIMSDQLATTQWLTKEFNISSIVLCSIHQLPSKIEHLNKLILKFENTFFHFAIEGTSGRGAIFLKNCFDEANYFRNAEFIDSTKTNWIELYKKIHNEIS